MTTLPTVLGPKSARQQGFKSITDPIDPTQEMRVLSGILRNLQGTSFVIIKHSNRHIEIARPSYEVKKYNTGLNA